MNILKYKGYEGTAELDMARMVCRGKILFIGDLVTYEAATPPDLKAQFEAAVDDYIDTCSELGREPQMPLQGVFQVRVPPELHKVAVLRAMADKTKLNDVVVRAIDAYVNVRAEVNHNHNVQVTLQVQGDSLQTLVASAAPQSEWLAPLNVH